MPRLRRTLHLRDPQRDVDDEIAFYFESLVADLVAQGLTRDDAEAEARRRFGDEQRYRWELAEIDGSYIRKLRWSDRLDALRSAFRYAFRSMSRARALSFSVVLTFALGIGANATVFQVIDRLLLRAPPHLSDPQTLRLYAIHDRVASGDREFNQAIHTYPTLSDLRGAKTVAGVTGYNFTPRDLTIGHGAAARRIKAQPVSGNYFSLLGVRPVLGRLLDARDDQAGAEAVMVLSYGYWQAQYGGSADVVGRTIDFGKGAYTVVGVLPRGFTGVELTPADVWLSLVQYRSGVDPTAWQLSRENHWLKVVVRLAPGATVEQAEAELSARNLALNAERKPRQRSSPQARVVLASLVPGESPLAPPEIGVSKWLVAVALIVLLVACINVANLLLARALRETRSSAIRLALGVTRARLIGQVTLEVLLFALLGGAAAIIVARESGLLIQHVLLPDYAWDALGFEPRVVWLTLAMAIVAALGAAVLPALQMLRPNVLDTMRASSAAIAGGASRLRSGLIVAQIALSAVLLSGAGLFVRSAHNAAYTDLGIETERAWFLSLVQDQDFADPRAVYERAVAALQSVPGVQAAGAASTLPFFNQLSARTRVEGWDSLPGQVAVHNVSGQYFDALGLQILAGRALGPQDAAHAEPAAVVSSAFARRLLPAGALGHCLYIGAEQTRCTRIVGVVEDAILTGIGGDTIMQYYVSALQKQPVTDLQGFSVRLRAEADAARTLAALRSALAGVDPRVRYIDAEAFTDMIASQLRPWRLGAVLFTVFGVLALIMATLGLYGVIAFDVTQRTKELGLRAALGATTDRLVGLIVRGALTLAAAGVVIGMLISIVAAPRLQQLLYSVSARDVGSRLVVALVLVATAIGAAAAPAFRASRIDPMRVLRGE